MPFFVPQVLPRELPAQGSAIERAIMDWKAIAPPSAFKRARAVAAFANHLGGTLLIGAQEIGGYLGSYPGLSKDDCAAARTDFSTAVEQRCQPKPLFDYEEYEAPDAPDRRVLAVNVWPSLLLIGVNTEHKDRSPTPAGPDDFAGRAYVYPVRTGIDSTYLGPNEIPMYMTPQVRRVAIMLSRIPLGTNVKVRYVGESSNMASFWLDSIDEEQNVVRVKPNHTDSPHSIPLDCITTVYETIDRNRNNASEWRIYVQYAR